MRSIRTGQVIPKRTLMFTRGECLISRESRSPNLSEGRMKQQYWFPFGLMVSSCDDTLLQNLAREKQNQRG